MFVTFFDGFSAGQRAPSLPLVVQSYNDVVAGHCPGSGKTDFWGSVGRKSVNSGKKQGKNGKKRKKTGENGGKSALKTKKAGKNLAKQGKSSTFAPAFWKTQSIRRREAALIKGRERGKDVMSNNLFNQH